jgi:hypothetical protein
VLCLIVVPLPPGGNPFAVKINNNNNNLDEPLDRMADERTQKRILQHTGKERPTSRKRLEKTECTCEVGTGLILCLRDEAKQTSFTSSVSSRWADKSLAL